MPVTNDKDNEKMNNYAAVLYDRYKRVIFTAAQGIVKDSLTAEDIVQETMLILVDQYDVMQELSEEERYRFVLRVAKNKAIDEYRRRGNASRFAGLLKKKTVLFHEDADEIVEECLGMELLEGVPLEYRLLLYRKYCCDYSVKELADYYNMSELKMSNYLRKARNIVKKERNKAGKSKY